MQYISRDMQRQLTKWIAALIVAVLGAFFGQEHLPGSGQRSPPGRTTSTGPAAGQISGAARAIDGDSMFVGRDEVRMKGIDAPEGRQSCTKDGRPWECGTACARRTATADRQRRRAVQRDRTRQAQPSACNVFRGWTRSQCRHGCFGHGRRLWRISARAGRRKSKAARAMGIGIPAAA